MTNKDRYKNDEQGSRKRQRLSVSSGHRLSQSVGCSRATPSLPLHAGRGLTFDKSSLQRVDLVALGLNALELSGTLAALTCRRRLCLLQRGPSRGLSQSRGLELIGRARPVRMARAQHGLHQRGLGKGAQKVRVG